MDENIPTTAVTTGTSRLLILIPAFNDWPSLGLLLVKLDDTLLALSLEAEVLVVDDASDEPIGDSLSHAYTALTRVQALKLQRNLGHQRAIAIGLAYSHDHLPSRAIVVMDADGEDDPCDVPRLLARCEETGLTKIVFAKRERRSEGATFRVFYVLFKTLHLLLTGRKVEIGNFSVIPGVLLPRLVVISETWNHYAAAVIKSRLPCDKLPTQRAQRLAGQSSMNFVSLVTHGLSAMSVFADTVGVRLLLIALLLVVLPLIALSVVFAVRFGTDLAIPGWATYTAGLLVVILFQSITTAVTFTFVTLSGRQGTSFIPRRDYSWVCGDLKQIHPAR